MVKIPVFFRPRKSIGIAMHVTGFLHKSLASVMHKKRLITLSMMVMTALRIKKISLTELGRCIDSSIQDQSGIRRADRFLGNKKLHKERELIHKIIVNKIRITPRDNTSPEKL